MFGNQKSADFNANMANYARDTGTVIDSRIYKDITTAAFEYADRDVTSGIYRRDSGNYAAMVGYFGICALYDYSKTPLADVAMDYIKGQFIESLDLFEPPDLAGQQYILFTMAAQCKLENVDFSIEVIVAEGEISIGFYSEGQLTGQFFKLPYENLP